MTRGPFNGGRFPVKLFHHHCARTFKKHSSARSYPEHGPRSYDLSLNAAFLQWLLKYRVLKRLHPISHKIDSGAFLPPCNNICLYFPNIGTD